MKEPNSLVIDSLAFDNTIKLRSPGSKKVINTPIYNAFNRENLGSIPTNSEIILFKDKQFQEKKGFLSQEYRFNRLADYKAPNPGPGDYNINTKSPNQSFSSKGYCNAFVSKSQRFDDTKEFYERFNPGPSDYKGDNSSIGLMADKSLKYNGLYHPLHTIKMKASTETPGPGQYNINNPHSEKYGLNSVFISKNKWNIARQFDYVSEPAKYHTELPLVKDADKQSYFFKVRDEMQINPIDKVLSIDKNIFKIPGVGLYDVTKQWPKVKSTFDIKQSFEERLKEEAEIKERIEKRVVKKPRKIKKADLLAFVEDESIKNSAKYIFDSQTTRLQDPGNHVPGPCYYKNTTKQPSKVEYRYNNDNIWV
jgi:hypothetical protein